MTILLLAATPPEIAPTVSWLRQQASQETLNVLHFPRVQIEVVFGGLGVVSTAYLLGKRFATQPPVQLAIQAGIAGALDRSLAYGQVVNVTSERLGDWGAEDRDGSLLSPADIGFPPGFPFDATGSLRPPGPAAILPFTTAAGLTVQRATGSDASIARLRTHFPDAQVESMEGAAFFYACLEAGVDALQLRGISNYVEARDRSKWQLTPAIEAVNVAVQQVLTPFIH
ncbi:Futalosine hydrolase [Neolewinella maritima]|uniref:Futalosine hydrolase n=1 Tax=Neolewinella maritima TaxID=1383882 RepID=A0ABM9B0U8_9BACT|nr:futalosine hydrolase [Neolewinella maritima]CAH1000426.1 Futalosine hydrolase [Neolewinella maritima]